MQNISESARMLGNGASVKLKDGSIQALVFDFEAIAMLEDKYGSLEQFVAVLQGNGKRFSAIKDAMIATLAHTGLAPAQIGKLLEFKEFQHYVEALTAAFYEGMPEGMAPENPLATASPNGSRGNGSTGQPPSPSDEATRNSSA